MHANDFLSLLSANYGAMLCVALTMLSHDVCLSVCLSHTGILPKRLKVSSNVSPKGSHTILVIQVLPTPKSGTTAAGVAYPGVRDNSSTVNTKTGYDDLRQLSFSFYRTMHLQRFIYNGRSPMSFSSAFMMHHQSPAMFCYFKSITLPTFS